MWMVRWHLSSWCCDSQDKAHETKQQTKLPYSTSCSNYDSYHLCLLFLFLCHLRILTNKETFYDRNSKCKNHFWKMFLMTLMPYGSEKLVKSLKCNRKCYWSLIYWLQWQKMFRNWSLAWNALPSGIIA